MKPAKLLFGATGFSIAAAALFMGAGTASAEICTTECSPPPPYFDGLTDALSKVNLVAVKLEGTTAGNKLVEFAAFNITKVLDKTSP